MELWDNIISKQISGPFSAGSYTIELLDKNAWSQVS